MLGQLVRKGTGIPLVFLHGFLGCRKDWQEVIAQLEGRTCFAYDLPGHGETPWPVMEITSLMESAFPPGPLDLVGYSLGGRLAMKFALHHPERIHRLTIVSSHYGIPTEEERQKRIQMDRVLAQKILTTPFDEFLRSWYTQPLFSHLQKENLPLFEKLLRRTTKNAKDLAKAANEWSLGRQPYYRDELFAFSKPFQVLCGERDPLYANLYQGWPQIRIIPEKGHMLHLEAPKEVALCL
jgi:2-succinyl-6-hydroxy-2,4-cyclohexadiene-1-carboxylate synthase